MVLVGLVSGCSPAWQPGGDASEYASPTDPPSLAREVATPGHTGTGPEETKDLRAVCRDVAQFVAGEIRKQNERLMVLGFQPQPVRLEIRPAAVVKKSEQKAVLVRRVCQLLADEVSRLACVSVSLQMDSAEPSSGSGCSLTVDVTNDFGAGGFFDRVHVLFALTLEGNRPAVYRASFASEGLCCVQLPDKEPQQVLVTTEKNAQVVSFEADSGRWFLVPVGSRVMLRAGGRHSPPLEAGLQNVWTVSDLASDSAAADSHEAQNQAASGGIRVHGLMLPPPLEQSSQKEEGPPHIEILAPVDGAMVPRRCTVSGRAVGLDGKSVQVLVHPIGDIDYPQSTDIVRDGTWACYDCIFGRAGQDSRQRFLVKARASSASGVVESPTITVTRQ